MQPRTVVSRGPGNRFGLVGVLLSCVLVAPALAAQSDTWITTKSKLALLTTEGVSSGAVSVDTSISR